MRILGLGGLDHNGAACVAEQGVITSFLEVERVTRQKNQGLDHPDAVIALLDRLGIERADHLAIADRTWFGRRRSWLLPLLAARFPGVECSVHAHHACHLACAAATSGMPEATLVSIDGKGDGLSAAAGHARSGGALRISIAVPSAHSLGRLWWAASEFAGFPGHHAAGKTMALAAFGRPRFLGAFARHRATASDGGFRFLSEGEHPDLFRQVPRLVEWMTRVAGVAPAAGEPAPEHCDMASTMQVITEEIVAAFVGAAISRTGCRSVCMAGGVALNGLANQRLIARGIADELHVPPVTDDRGLALGAVALASAAHGVPVCSPAGGISPFLGVAPAAWSDDDPVFTRRVEEVESIGAIAGALIEGQIVGWFEGRDEAGPRALGHRSILASPTRHDIRVRLNAVIKQREAFRPFGCSILRSSVSDWFACEEDTPYMLRIVEAIPTRRSEMPGALHVDGTSRLHTVTAEHLPRLARVLEELVRRGHPPLLVNTSMNRRGEPLVHTASEAFALARAVGLDAMMIEGVLYMRERP